MTLALAACSGCSGETGSVPLDDTEMIEVAIELHDHEPVQDPDSIDPIEHLGSKEAEDLPLSALCVHIPTEVEARWPFSAELSLEAIGRWNLDYEVGPEACPVHLGLNPRVKWAKTMAIGGKAIIGLNPNAPIVDTDECSSDGEWGERQHRFVDIVTHEFGHVLGLPEAEPGTRGCAMCATPSCNDIYPLDHELEAAGVKP